MAGGARVVPIDFRMPENELKRELKQINGLYIPGDAQASYEHEMYQYQVQRILAWAQDHNSDEARHFPVVGVSYGMLTMMASQYRSGQ